MAACNWTQSHLHRVFFGKLSNKNEWKFAINYSSISVEFFYNNFTEFANYCHLKEKETPKKLRYIILIINFTHFNTKLVSNYHYSNYSHSSSYKQIFLPATFLSQYTTIKLRCMQLYWQFCQYVSTCLII